MIKQLKLKNWKCYSTKNFEFTPGINIIIGPMGSGKSSILQAISFSLFGTFSELKSRELKTSELVNRNAAETDSSVILSLELNNQELNITKKLDTTKGVTEAVVRTPENNLLAGPNVSATNEYLKNNLKLDEDTFLRAIYSRQNDIDLFLRLTPTERKKRIDELMGLNKFEEARKSCVSLQNKIKTKKETKQESLSSQDLSKVKQELSNLYSEIESLNKEESSILETLELETKNKEIIDSQLKNKREKLNYYNKLVERKEILHREIKELDSKFEGKEVEGDINELLGTIHKIKLQISELSKEKQEKKNNQEELRNKSLALEKKLAILEQKKKDLSSKLDELTNISTEIQKIKDQHPYDPVKELAKLEEELQTKTKEQQSKILEIGNLKENIDELRDAGSVCPVCSSSLSDEIKSRLINEREKQIQNLQESMDSLKANIENLDSKKKEVQEIHEKIKELNIKVADHDIITKELKITNNELEQYNKEFSSLSNLQANIASEIRSTEEKIEYLISEQNQLVEKKTLYEWKDKKAKLNQEYSELLKELEETKVNTQEVENLEKQFQELIRKIQELTSKKSSITQIYNEKQKRLSDLIKKKEDLEKVQQEIKLLESQIEFLTKFKAALLKSQETIRKDLILAVNEIMTSIWAEIYPYDWWNSVRLLATEQDYILQIRDQDWVSVAGFASGGERTLACLAARIAFAKILAPNLSLLILDEPTHNLDQTAISKLTEVIQNKLSEFIDQVFIVTHDEKLAEASDNLIKIEKSE